MKKKSGNDNAVVLSVRGAAIAMIVLLIGTMAAAMMVGREWVGERELEWILPAVTGVAVYTGCRMIRSKEEANRMLCMVLTAIIVMAVLLLSGMLFFDGSLHLNWKLLIVTVVGCGFACFSGMRNTEGRKKKNRAFVKITKRR